MAAYYRKRDEVIFGDQDSQTQNPRRLSQMPQQFTYTQTQRYQGEENSASLSGPIQNSLDQSQCKEEEMNWIKALNEVNEETFKKANAEKLKKQEQYKLRKINGTGKFNFTQKQLETPKSEFISSNLPPHISVQIKTEPNYSALQPKVNRKYQITPSSHAQDQNRDRANSSTGNSVVDYMNCKQEGSEDISNSSQGQDTHKKKNNVDTKMQKKRNQFMKDGEFASNTSFEEFLNKPFNNIQPEIDQPMEEENKGSKKKTGNKKRKIDEITNPLDHVEPKKKNKRKKPEKKVNEPIKYEQANETIQARDNFLAPDPISFLAKKSAFFIKVKPPSHDRIVNISKPQPSLQPTSLLFPKQQKEEEEDRNTFKYQSINACKDFFNSSNEDLDQDYLVVNVKTIIKKYGVQYIIGQIATFRFKDQKSQEFMAKNKPQVKVMIPPLKSLQSGDNIMKNNKNFDASSRSSTGSFGSVQNKFEGLVIVESPIILQERLEECQTNEYFMTILGKRINNLDESILKDVILKTNN